MEIKFKIICKHFFIFVLCIVYFIGAERLWGYFMCICSNYYSGLRQRFFTIGGEDTLKIFD